MSYTHILNIKLSDENNNLMENPKLLNEIKQQLNNKVISQIVNTDKYGNLIYFNKWKLISLKKPFNYLLPGDLITDTDATDTMLFEHTKLTLMDIEKELKEYDDTEKWYICFYINKVLSS
jgi:hypothetical protein